MLSLNNVTLRRGPRKLLEGVSFTIYPGWRAGLIGRNGTGKSSLFALLLGELHNDAGNVAIPRGIVIATVPQETPPLPDLAIEYVLDGDTELRDLERRLVDAETAHDAQRIAEIHDRLNTIGGYAARSRAARLLHGLGFTSESQVHTVASFSGGWRMRLNLARTLMCRSDLLLLDEPTNHLDLDAVLWVQDWLRSYPGTLMCISHDREFLDAVTTHTLHVHGETVTLYAGNYSQFERQRAERVALQSAAFDKQQKQIAHLQTFINRFKAKASKATQAQSRVKQLERMQLVAPAHFDSEFSFEFPEPQRLPSPLIRFDDVSAGYPAKTVLTQLKVHITPGDRIGLLGRNGAGKSTLVRTLAGELPTLAGNAMRDPYLRVGYFAQHQVEQLDPKASPILHLQRFDPRASAQSLRDFLGGFNFRGDRAFEAVEPFSGGEKARLALALVVYRQPNLLLLDEPTNHLDLDMRHALETALTSYAGAVVLVSHDRHLLSATCDELWLVANGRCETFAGDLDEYASWLTSRQDDKPRAEKAASSTSPKERRKAAADERALRAGVAKLDAQLSKLHVELARIDEQLADPAVYTANDPAKITGLRKQQSNLRARIVKTEEEWLSAADRLESQ